MANGGRGGVNSVVSGWDRTGLLHGNLVQDSPTWVDTIATLGSVPGKSAIDAIDADLEPRARVTPHQRRTVRGAATIAGTCPGEQLFLTGLAYSPAQAGVGGAPSAPGPPPPDAGLRWGSVLPICK